MRAFWSLSTCRNNGFGLGHIPWNFIHDYGKIKRLTEENLDVFIECILAMDRAYLEWEAAEAERRKAEKK